MQERARAKIERALSFSGGGEMDMLGGGKKARTPRDQMSHRIIEKRRRDRMNNCLANLSQLIPVNYLKQGQGRIEKTEIIEMAIRHITHLQKQVQAMSTMERPCCQEKFLMGYKECRDEVMRFLVEKAGYDAADPFCLTLLKHLHKQSQKFVPESATSVYQNTSGGHQGMVGAEDVMMQPQNAGEVGGMMGDGNLAPSPPLNAASLTSLVNDGQNKHNSASSWVSTMNDNSGLERLEINNSNHGAGTSPGGNGSSHLRHHLQHLSTGGGVAISMPSVPLQSVSGESGYSTGRDVGDSSTPGSHRPISQVQRVSSSASNSAGSSTTRGGSPLEQGDTSSETSNTKQVYKFKNDIKLRFVGGNDKHALNSGTENSDQNSNSSKEDSDYPPQPRNNGAPVNSKCKIEPDWAQIGKAAVGAEDNSKMGSVSRDVQWRLSAGAAASSADIKDDYNLDAEEGVVGTGNKNDVPAFALHPLGTFYVPLVIKMAHLSPYLHNNNSMQLCHPISIPVNFSRPATRSTSNSQGTLQPQSSPDKAGKVQIGGTGGGGQVSPIIPQQTPRAMECST